MSIAAVLRVTAGLVLGCGAAAVAQDEAADAGGPWPAEVKDFKPVEPGEHPRLLFRKSDLPALKAKAATPEGQAILKRLRATLDGRNGDSFPTVFNGSGAAYAGNKPSGEGDAGANPGEGNTNKNPGKSGEMPLGTYSFSHAAGYGLLYQLTGDKKYAELGKQAMEKALEGVRDRDDRYSFRKPGGALRAGPSIGWTALGYDLCYDGWDEEFRKKVADAIATYNEGQWMSLPELAAGKRQHPGSNHWGMQVGGAAMALLAIMNDPGVDMDKIKPLLDVNGQCMITNVTKGFGDGGFFAEGDGTGSMASHIAYLTGLQAWKTAAGKDYVSPRPNAQWTAFRWFLQTISKDGKPDFSPQRGGYPHNIWARDGLSGGGYFSIGYGVSNPDQKAALLWYYNHGGFRAADDRDGTPLDTPSPYPHHAVLSFVNWPVGMAEKNPAGIIPNAVRDSKFGFYCWRNRWQDQDDIVISILSKTAKGNMSAGAEKTLSINAGGKKLKWGTINGGFTGEFKPGPDGSTVLTTGDESCLAIDFSGASGADAMLVMTGPGAPGDTVVEAGGQKFSFLFLGGTAPTPQAAGDKVQVGQQTVSFADGKIVLAKSGGPRVPAASAAPAAPAAGGPAAKPASAKPAAPKPAGDDDKMLTNRLNAAKGYLKAGNKPDGLRILRDIAKTSPDTPQGQEAAKLLNDLGAKP